MDEKELAALNARNKMYNTLKQEGYYTGSNQDFHLDYAQSPEVQKELHRIMMDNDLLADDSKDFSKFQERYFYDVNKNLVVDKNSGLLVPKKKEVGGGKSDVGLPTTSPQEVTTPTTSTETTNQGVAPIVPTTIQEEVSASPISDVFQKLDAQVQELINNPTPPTNQGLKPMPDNLAELIAKDKGVDYTPVSELEKLQKEKSDISPYWNSAKARV